MFGDGDSELMNNPREDVQSKSGGWGTSGQLTTGKVDNVTFQAVFPKAGTYTIEFNLTPIEAGATDIPIRCEALVTWVVEGNFVSRRISVGNGVSITGVAQGAKVVIDDHTDKTVPGSLGKKYNVSLQIAPGPRGTNGSPPILNRTEFVQSLLGPLAGNPIDIPPDCGANAILVTVLDDTVGGPAPIAEQDTLAEELANSAFMTFGFDPVKFGAQWIPIIPGTTKIKFLNFRAGKTYTFRFTLGIDG